MKKLMIKTLVSVFYIVSSFFVFKQCYGIEEFFARVSQGAWFFYLIFNLIGVLFIFFTLNAFYNKKKKSFIIWLVLLIIISIFFYLFSVWAHAFVCHPVALPVPTGPCIPGNPGC